MYMVDLNWLFVVPAAMQQSASKRLRRTESPDSRNESRPVVELISAVLLDHLDAAAHGSPVEVLIANEKIVTIAKTPSAQTLPASMG
jgi:hypothetical protein